MLTVCQTCGDRGFVEALTYCSVCGVSAQHQYCFNMVVRVPGEVGYWVCQDCSSADSSITDDTNDESLCINGQEIESKFELVHADVMDNTGRLISTHPLQAETVCREIVVPESVLPQNEDELPLEEPQQNLHVLARPIPDPIWRGSMIIQNRNWRLDGLVACLSTLASSKVQIAINILPELLSLEILPRIDIWPKRLKSKTSLDSDIGVYFFPENQSNQNDFDKLLGDMNIKDTALKASFPFADLLIFTYLQQPEPHHRFQDKHYLWGLFSRENFSSKSAK